MNHMDDKPRFYGYDKTDDFETLVELTEEEDGTKSLKLVVLETLEETKWFMAIVEFLNRVGKRLGL